MTLSRPSRGKSQNSVVNHFNRTTNELAALPTVGRLYLAAGGGAYIHLVCGDGDRNNVDWLHNTRNAKAISLMAYNYKEKHMLTYEWDSEWRYEPR